MLQIARPWRHKPNPWEPVDYHDEDGDTSPVVYAVRAFLDGKATESQQFLFRDWLRHACAADDWAFRPGDQGQRNTDIMLGRQFVWAQVIKMQHPLVTPKAKGQQMAAKPVAPKKSRGRPRKVKNA